MIVHQSSRKLSRATPKFERPSLCKVLSQLSWPQAMGKRMKSVKAKVLHEVCGRPMIHYVVDAARGAGASTIIIVVGYAADQVRQCFHDEPDILFATQTEQLGTGHAGQGLPFFIGRGTNGLLLVLVGDEPLLRPQPLADLLKRQEIDQAACLLGTAVMDDPMGFGRILRDSTGRFLPCRRTRLLPRRICTQRGQSELLRLHATGTLECPRPDRYQQYPE